MAATRMIETRTAIPGPRSRALLERERRAIAHPLIVHLPIFAERAENATITDVDGNVFVDFAGGVGVVNAGHAHPRIVEAVVEQAARFLHTDFTVVPYEPAVALAERLCAVAPISGETRAAFFNAGTEAVENAVKLARLHTGRPGVIAFEGAFHGRTLLSMTMTSKFHPYKTGMGPYAPEVYRAPFPDAYRGPDAAEALERLARMLETHVPAEHVAAIVIEPQLGEGGFVPASREYMQGLRALCDSGGIVLVADEVQTGFGRTGRMFAMEHFGVEPDLMTVAKSIAAGLPLSGVIGRAEIMDGAHTGAIGGTYIGNPVAQAAALAVLDVFEEESLLERAGLVGERIRQRMHEWQSRWPAIGDVRGLGVMLAIELVRDPASKEPAPELAKAVIDAALERGLILLKAGLHGNCIRVLCPLTIEEAVLEEALEAWEDALEAALAS
jgi:4-aminobutyrate aminotransferase / (S)-3-amino-2-methylpropionate transaminase / 5-aminovalerate transaminase